MKKAIYEIWSISKHEKVDLSVAVNMFYRNCIAKEDQYVGSGEYDYSNPVEWGQEEMRQFNKLYQAKYTELVKAYAEGDREGFESIVCDFFGRKDKEDA